MTEVLSTQRNLILRIEDWERGGGEESLLPGYQQESANIRAPAPGSQRVTTNQYNLYHNLTNYTMKHFPLNSNLDFSSPKIINSLPHVRSFQVRHGSVYGNWWDLLDWQILITSRSLKPSDVVWRWRDEGEFKIQVTSTLKFRGSIKRFTFTRNVVNVLFTDGRNQKFRRNLARPSFGYSRI